MSPYTIVSIGGFFFCARTNVRKNKESTKKTRKNKEWTTKTRKKKRVIGETLNIKRESMIRIESEDTRMLKTGGTSL